MQTFIMLTQLSPESAHSPRTVESMERAAMNAVREACPTVDWLESYAVMGRWDYIDVFRAPDNETALKVAMLVRIGGHARTEVMPATPWPRFKELIRTLPEVEGLAVVGH